jgi:prepilin signal peptidase PulO-like enzyme (type II secretory pathway)
MARFAVGAAILLFAARSDVLTRRVTDLCWWALLVIGLFILEAQLVHEGESFIFLLSPLYIVVFFLSLWYEGEVLGDNIKAKDGMKLALVLNLGAFVVLGAQVAAGSVDPRTDEGMRHVQLFTVPLMMLLAYGFYRAQLLSGGADAKAFLALAVLLPFYPAPLLGIMELPGIFQLICPFVLAVFFTGAFFTLLQPLGMLIYNLSRADRGKLMAFAFRVPIAEARTRKFIWLSECIEGGEHRYLYFRFRGYDKKWKHEQLRLLAKEGLTKVWVQPQIPFMVYLAAGLLFNFVVGNIIFFVIVKTVAGV